MFAKRFFSASKRLLRRQEGLTLVEMVATLSLLAILMGMSVGALSYYFAGRSVDVAAREVVTQIREAQSLALATGNTHRIDFSGSSGTSYVLQRRQGADWVTVKGPLGLPGGVSFNSASQPLFGNDQYIEFYARGVAEDGQMVLEGRYGKSKTVTVEGETVNVNIT